MLNMKKCNHIWFADKGKKLELFLAKYKGEPLRHLQVGCGVITLAQEEAGEEGMSPARRLIS